MFRTRYQDLSDDMEMAERIEQLAARIELLERRSLSYRIISYLERLWREACGTA